MESVSGNVVKFKRGLTWRAFFGLVTTALLFIPVNIYLNLTIGVMVATAAVYVITILLSEIARRTGNPLSKQEIFIMYATVGAVAATIPPYYWLVYRAFFVNTPVTYAYSINGVPLPHLVPDWIAPPPGSSAYMFRTLFQPEWLKPILVATFFFILGFLGDLGLSILLSYTTVEVLKLRFPFATIDASLVETISASGQEKERLRIFMMGFYSGLIYGALLYGSLIVGVQILPLPWADLTWYTEKYVPGAIVGVATDPASFVFGLVLPLSTSVNMLAGSLLVWVILNCLFTVNPGFFPKWANEYHPGMSIASIYQRTFQRIWISPQFGFAVGLAAALVILLRKNIVKALSQGIKKDRSMSECFPSFTLAVVLFLVGSLGSVALFSLLVPEMPIYIPLLTSLVLSPLIGILAAYSVGEIGFFPNMPWPWQAIVYLSPYQGYAGWVTSPYICLGTPGSVSQMVKASYITETNPKDYFKTWIIAVFLNLAFGLIIVDALWRLAPIPSSAYPASIIYWPMYATNDSLYVTRQIRLDPFLFGVTSIFSFILYFAGSLLQRIGIPFSPVAFIVGCYTLPPNAITTFLGSFIGHYVIRRYIGREKWNFIRGILAAGILAGVGVFMGIGVSMTLLAKAAWVWPW